MIFAALVVLLLMLVPLEHFSLLRSWPALREELQDIGHPIVFAVLAMIGRQALQKSFDPVPGRQLIFLGIGLVAFAALTELLQALTTRDSSFGDLFGDLLGICAGLLWRPRNRLAMTAAVLAAALACAPLVWTLCAYLHRQNQSPVIWRADSVLLHRFARWQAGSYPGLVLQEVPADWRGFSTLVVVVRNAHPQATPFTVRIHDVLHDERHADRFNRTFTVAAESTATFHIPLDDVAAAPADRRLDLAAVDGIVVFQLASEATAGFAPLEIRLAR